MTMAEDAFGTANHSTRRLLPETGTTPNSILTLAASSAPTRVQKSRNRHRDVSSDQIKRCMTHISARLQDATEPKRDLNLDARALAHRRSLSKSSAHTCLATLRCCLRRNSRLRCSVLSPPESADDGEAEELEETFETVSQQELPSILRS
eukprot:CAMPEP_0194543384 /NCGR_PEP_ID=MMETSP0253-20130528/85712_1 /TAXON_ID=2966 /ORGANISM="Noctiluca scintillans" /LENGTH=149 /DNA_ID=CAMNT_0039390141 /DNA_START=192 /DNA_END=638 /DNA_ORIENTATION=-